MHNTRRDAVRRLAVKKIRLFYNGPVVGDQQEEIIDDPLEYMGVDSIDQIKDTDLDEAAADWAHNFIDYGWHWVEDDDE